MPGKELVSVILPVYNAAPFVRATVQSLLDQTHEELEIIAVDDGSTDESFTILQELAKNESRIKAYSKPNGGVSTALNFALRKCEGDYIARMDADDLCYRTRIEEQLPLLQRSETVALCSTGVDYTFFKGRVFVNEIHSTSSSEIKVKNLFSAVHVTPTVIFDARKIGKEELFFDETYLVAEDYELFARIGARHDTAILPKAKLLVRRQSHGNLTHQMSKRIGDYHFKVAERECANAGIVSPQEGVLDLLCKDELIGEAGVETLLKWFSPIAAYDGFKGHEGAAYRDAVSDFVDVLIDTLYDRMSLKTLTGFLHESGLDAYMSSRNKIQLRIRRFGASPAARAVATLRQIRRYVKSRPREYLSAELTEIPSKGF